MLKNNQENKFNIQDNQYLFPYHYIPYLDLTDCPRRSRFLGWGLDYLCYLLHIREMIIEKRPQSLLDVGCGDGRFLSLLYGHVQDLTGCDLSKKAIDFAKAFNENINYLCLDADLLDGEFDIVTAIEVLEHIPDEQIPSFVKTLCSKARVGGHIVVCVPSTLIKIQEKHYRHYNENLLDSQMEMAGIGLKKTQCTRVIKHRDIIYQIYLRMTSNKFFQIEIPFLNKLIWKYIWGGRINPSKGMHIIATYEKVSH